jgi:MFS family permease
MKKAWMMVVIAIAAGVVSVMGMFRIPPTMILLMQDMKIDLTVFSLLMTVCSFASAVFTLPSGALMQKVGPKNIGLLAMAISIAAIIIQAASSNFVLHLAGRALEGITFGMMGMVIPAIITIWFPAEKRGLPMSIFSLWVSIGILLVFNITNFIVPDFGWRGLWWFNAILFVIIGIIFALFVKYPDKAVQDQNARAQSPQKVSIMEGFKSPGAWLLALIFGLAGFSIGAFSGFYPTYLVQNFKLDMASANMYSSIATIGMMVGGIILGFILNKVNYTKHTIVLIISVGLTAIFAFIQFNFSYIGLLVPFLMVLGFAFQLVPATVFTIAPEAATRPDTIAPTMSIINFGSALGSMLANSLVGMMVQNAGGKWNVVSIPLLLLAIVGLIFSIIVHRMLTKKYKARSNTPLEDHRQAFIR